jgi:glycosyltransferase involved in cell wall biosynthesis
LPWKLPLGGDVDNFYFDSFWTKLRLLKTVLVANQDEFLLVGYSNIISKLILLFYYCLGRKLCFWTDHPEPVKSLKKIMGRKLAYAIMRRCVKKIFVVGERGREYFLSFGFSPCDIENLPICIAVPDKISDASCRSVRQSLGVEVDDLLIVAASRLTKNKGYDILLRSLTFLPLAVRTRLSVLIVGSGPEYASLKLLSEDLGLSDIARFLPWIEIAEYERAVASADIFIHPARFDAFGGGTLYAMAAGVAIIASDGVGSAVERIVDGENGMLFTSGNERDLAGLIERLSTNAELRRKLSLEARATALKWTPHRSSQILFNAIKAPA